MPGIKPENAAARAAFNTTNDRIPQRTAVSTFLSVGSLKAMVMGLKER